MWCMSSHAPYNNFSEKMASKHSLVLVFLQINLPLLWRDHKQGVQWGFLLFAEHLVGEMFCSKPRNRDCLWLMVFVCSLTLCMLSWQPSFAMPFLSFTLPHCSCFFCFVLCRHFFVMAGRRVQSALYTFHHPTSSQDRRSSAERQTKLSLMEKRAVSLLTSSVSTHFHSLSFFFSFSFFLQISVPVLSASPWEPSQ